MGELGRAQQPCIYQPRASKPWKSPARRVSSRVACVDLCCSLSCGRGRGPVLDLHCAHKASMLPSRFRARYWAVLCVLLVWLSLIWYANIMITLARIDPDLVASDFGLKHHLSPFASKNSTTLEHRAETHGEGSMPHIAAVTAFQNREPANKRWDDGPRQVSLTPSFPSSTKPNAADQDPTQRNERAYTKDLVIVGDEEWAGGVPKAKWAFPLPVRPYRFCQYHLNVTCHLRPQKHRILVLLWFRFWRAGPFPNLSRVANFQCCDGVVWSYTADRSLLPLADIVEFHLPSYDPAEVPKLQPWQLVSVVTGEPDIPHAQLISRGANILRSYRLDADLHHGFEPVGSCYTDRVRRHLAVPFSKKRSGVPLTALVRRCNTNSGREHVLESLISAVPVHSHGTCMHNWDVDDRDKIYGYLKQYTFLFSIENTLCKGYISEKWQRNFMLGTIPLVASYRNQFPDYASSAPTDHSYVNVFDYKTVRDLAAHLRRVSEDSDLFHSYHSFRGSTGRMSAEFLKTFGPSDDPGGYCALAEKIMNPTDLQRLQRRHLTTQDVVDCVKQPRILSTFPVT